MTVPADNPNMEDADFNIYDNPDMEDGPLSEPSEAERKADYQAAVASWLKLPAMERMELESYLRQQGVDTDLLGELKPTE